MSVLQVRDDLLRISSYIQSAIANYAVVRSRIQIQVAGGCLKFRPDGAARLIFGLETDTKYLLTVVLRR